RLGRHRRYSAQAGSIDAVGARGTPGAPLGGKAEQKTLSLSSYRAALPSVPAPPRRSGQAERAVEDQMQLSLDLRVASATYAGPEPSRGARDEWLTRSWVA